MLRAALPGCFALLALTAAVAAEQRTPGSGGISFKPLVQTQPSLQPPPAPYPMTYSEQVARSLGVHDGGVALRGPDRSNPYAPSVSFNGSMLRLKWRP